LPADWVVINLAVAAFVVYIIWIVILTNWQCWRTRLLFWRHSDCATSVTAGLASAQFWTRMSRQHGTTRRRCTTAAAVMEFGHSREATLSLWLTRFNAAIWLLGQKQVH
jgi:hypothetical protein